MGYSTALYAVDLDKLKAVVGSADAKLIRRLRPAAKGSKKDPNFGPRVWYTRKKELLLDGQPVTWKELIAELSRPKWKGSQLYVREDARWKGDGLGYQIIDACSEGMAGSYFAGLHIGADDEEWYGTAVELTPELAAAELVEGKLSQPKMDYLYGYGLEKLCEELGTLSTSIEGSGMLKGLKLDTPLSEKRTPIPLIKPKGEFPLIGYLTPDEVQSEVDRLGAMDLSYPKDDEIEEDRQDLLQALRKAAQKKLGVVAFYH